jgi:hypothetical protein
MSMNDHPHGEQLSAYIDAMLDVAQMRLVAQHLDNCAACRTSLASLSETRTLLHGMGLPPAPGPDFWMNTFRRLRVESQGASITGDIGNRLRLHRAGTPRRWAAGVTAAVMLGALAFGPWLAHPPSEPTSPPPAVLEDFVDMPSLVRAHTDSAAREPLADADRQTMISADTDDLGMFNDASSEAAGDEDSVAADAAH